MRFRLPLTGTATVLCVLLGQELPAQEAAPTQIAWQRTLEDALALVEASGRPLLVITNDPNEPLSNRLANRIYRTEEFVALTRGFICVLASPHEDGQNEYDSRGRRRPSSLYGRVLKREYVQIEPKLFERYFDGNRVAPRHLGVSPDGEILFDIFLTNDVSKITSALKKHGKPELAIPDVGTVALAMMESPANRDRMLVEQLAVEGDAALRASIMGKALPDPGTRHPDVIRLGLRDPEPSVRLAAAEELAEGASLDELEFLPAAAQALETAGKSIEPLLARFEKIAKAGRADRPAWADATESQTHRLRGMQQPSRFDEDGWIAALENATVPEGSRWAGTAPAVDRDTMDQRLGELERAIREAEADSRDLRRLEWIEATLDYARVLLRDGADPGFAFSDCVSTGTELMQVPQTRLRAAAVVAIAGYLTGDAGARDAGAVALKGILTGDEGAPPINARSTAEVLDALSNSMRSEIYAASSSKPSLDTLADAAAIASILPHHPLATLDQGLACVDFFSWAGARAKEAAAIDALLRRFPAETRIHDRLRAQRLRDHGPAELSRTYEAWRTRQDAEGRQAFATAEWFTGVAFVQIASTYILDGQPKLAVRSARSALQHLDSSALQMPGFADSANHWAVFARSAEARAQMELGDLDAAAEAAIESLQRRPASVEIDDWLGTNPKIVAGSVASALSQAGRSEDAKSLRTAIQKLTSD